MRNLSVTVVALALLLPILGCAPQPPAQQVSDRDPSSPYGSPPDNGTGIRSYGDVASGCHFKYVNDLNQRTYHADEGQIVAQVGEAFRCHNGQLVHANP